MEPIIRFHGGDDDAGDVVIVETIAPAGMVLEQHKHDHGHLSVLAVGRARVTVDGEATEYEGPRTITIPAGKEHKVEALTHIAWYCTWAASVAPMDAIKDCLKLGRA